MYLNTHEQERTIKVVGSFNLALLQDTIVKFRSASVFRMVTVLVVYIMAMTAIRIFLGFEETRAKVALFAVFIGAMFLLRYHFQKRLRQLATENTFEKWFKEINELETSEQHRQLFLDVVNSMQYGLKKESVVIAEEAMNSLALRKLTFIREAYRFFAQNEELLK